MYLTFLKTMSNKRKKMCDFSIPVHSIFGTRQLILLWRFPQQAIPITVLHCRLPCLHTFASGPQRILNPSEVVRKRRRQPLYTIYCVKKIVLFTRETILFHKCSCTKHRQIYTKPLHTIILKLNIY